MNYFGKLQEEFHCLTNTYASSAYYVCERAFANCTIQHAAIARLPSTIHFGLLAYTYMYFSVLDSCRCLHFIVHDA